MSPCLHVSMSSCLHFSICPCLHFSICPCFHVSCQCIYVSMSPCLHVSMSPCLYVFMSPYTSLNVSGILQTEIRTNGKRQLPFMCCKRKTANFCLFAATGTGKRKFVFLGRQTINGNRRLLFQKTCPSITLNNPLFFCNSVISRVFLLTNVANQVEIYAVYKTERENPGVAKLLACWLQLLQSLPTVLLYSCIAFNLYNLDLLPAIVFKDFNLS